MFVSEAINRLRQDIEKKVMKKLFSMFVMSVAALCAAGEVVTYQAGEGVETIGDFTVKVRQCGAGDAGQWLDVAVYPVKVDEVRGARHNTETASMAYFDFDGEVEVAVTYNGGAVDSACVRPRSYAIVPQVDGSTLTFTLDRPRNLSVEVNGDIFHNLHLFANPIDTKRPTEKQLKQWKKGKNRDLVYFAPGVHRLPGDTLRIESGQTVYVDGGARVYGQLIADGVENVRFYGRGEVHPQGRGEGIYIKNSRNVVADGVVVSQIPVGGSDGVSVNNVKSISYYGWGDGMNVFASSNVSYNGVFCRNSDDCSTVYATRKGFTGGCRNIKMENSTLWADVAHPIFIGLHGNVENPDTIENIVYRNIDILDHAEKQLDYQGCMAINAGDNNLVRNVFFDNIRIEDFREGQLVNLRIFFNKKYCGAPGRGIENVLFKDVTYDGHGENLSIISGYDADHKICNIRFENLVINGVRISDDMAGKPKWYKTGDMGRIYVGEHVEGVIFE